MHAGRTLYQSLLWRGLFYCSSFLLNIFIARHFQAALSGEIYYLCNIYSLVILFAGLSIESGIVYFAARNEIPAGKLFNFSFLWSLLTGILVLCVFATGIYKATDLNFIIFSALSFICGNLLITYCSSLFYAKHNFVLPNLVCILTNLALMILLPYDDGNYFYWYFGSFLLQGIILAIAARVKYMPLGSLAFLSMKEFRLLFRYCAMAYTANIVFFFLYRVDYWFVQHYCTPGELGNYIQVSKLGQLFFVLPTILASAVFPLTAGGQKETINRYLKILSSGILFLYAIACLVLALTGDWLFPFIFGKSFSSMYTAFLFLIPGILSLSGLFILTAYYAGKNRVSVNINGALLALAVVLAGDIIFIPRYGINAAALTSSMGYIIYQAYVLWVFRKEYQTSLTGFFVVKFSDWRSIIKDINKKQ